MFKFDFDIERDENDDLEIPQQSSSTYLPTPVISHFHSTGTPGSCHHVTLDELLDSLPETISYSPIDVPGLEYPLLRRDLFDARFQLISHETGNISSTTGADRTTNGMVNGAVDETVNGSNGTIHGTNGDISDKGEGYIDAGTDLVPGLYEGGLKTWEGGVDLVEVLSRRGRESGGDKVVADWVRGGNVLEVGCGTALPTAFLLRSLLSLNSPTSPSTKLFTNPSTNPSINPSTGTTMDLTPRTTLHLQDFNRPVLALVTVPNLLLATVRYLPRHVLYSPIEDDHVESQAAVRDAPTNGRDGDGNGNGGEEKEDDQGEIDFTQPGILSIHPALKSAFKRLLEKRSVDLRFTYGHWSGLAREWKGENGRRVSTTSPFQHPERPQLSQQPEQSPQSHQSQVLQQQRPTPQQRYDLVITAETIYSEESVHDLLAVLQSSTASISSTPHPSYQPPPQSQPQQPNIQAQALVPERGGPEQGQGQVQARAPFMLRSTTHTQLETQEPHHSESQSQSQSNHLPTGSDTLESSLGDLRVDGEDWGVVPLRDARATTVLVAAKVLYFGVGGGIQAFLDRVQGGGGWFETVTEWTSGVSRKVVRIGW